MLKFLVFFLNVFENVISKNPDNMEVLANEYKGREFKIRSIKTIDFVFIFFFLSYSKREVT